MEPTVYQAPILHERQYRVTSREIQGTIVHQLLLRSATLSVGSAQEATVRERHRNLAGGPIVGEMRTSVMKVFLPCRWRGYLSGAPATVC
jgi:hypothetical protein